MVERDPEVRCDRDNGMFEPIQCRRLPTERDMRIPPTALLCHCVNMSGEMIANTLAHFMRGDDRPDCEDRSKSRLNISIQQIHMSLFIHTCGSHGRK